MAKRKPVIGIAGGIGSGKSLVARQMASLGAARFDADAVAKAALGEPEVVEAIVQRWGPAVLDPQGRIDRRELARVVFADAHELRYLEGLIHPRVARACERFIGRAQADPSAKAVVLDVPLLFEAGLAEACDRIVFVEADRAARQARLAEHRGWDATELARREKCQWPLDKKRQLAHDIIRNQTSEAECLAQVREVFSRIMTFNDRP